MARPLRDRAHHLDGRDGHIIQNANGFARFGPLVDMPSGASRMPCGEAGSAVRASTPSPYTETGSGSDAAAGRDPTSIVVGVAGVAETIAGATGMAGAATMDGATGADVSAATGPCTESWVVTVGIASASGWDAGADSYRQKMQWSASNWRKQVMLSALTAIK